MSAPGKMGPASPLALATDGSGRSNPILVLGICSALAVAPVSATGLRQAGATRGHVMATDASCFGTKGKGEMQVVEAREDGKLLVDASGDARKTTGSVGAAPHTPVASFLADGMALQPLDLGLTADAVTRATPGYPRNLQVPPHLREEVRRADFMLPPGMTNVALDKPVTSSMSEEPIIGDLKQITDGIKRSGEFDFVELDPGPQWVQIDLGRPYTLHCIAVWHYYRNPVIYNDVIVQLAAAAGFDSDVRTAFNNDHDNSSGQGVGTDTAYFARWWSEVIDTRGASKEGMTARFIRVWSNGACGGEPTRFVEIQAYGK